MHKDAASHFTLPVSNRTDPLSAPVCVQERESQSHAVAHACRQLSTNSTSLAMYSGMSLSHRCVQNCPLAYAHKQQVPPRSA